MKKYLIALLIMSFVGGIVLWTGSGVALAKGDKSPNQISPNSPFYFLDRLAEKVIVVFLPENKKASFRMKVSRERFDEAVIMQKAGKSEKSSELFNEGLGEIGKALKSWKRCLEKDIDMSGLKADLKIVVTEARSTFNELKKEFKPEKIADFFKELAEITKIQIEVLIN